MHFYIPSDCHVKHHTAVGSLEVEEKSLCVCVCAHALAFSPLRKKNADTIMGSQSDAYSYLINYTSICNRREDLSLGKRRREYAGRGPGEGGEGRSSKPK